MLAAPEEDGTPLLDHLLAAERQTGTRPQILLDAPVLPDGCEELWQIFNELHACRGNTGFGPMRITYADMHAFEQVSGTKLRPWERDAIRRADTCFLAREAERVKQSSS